MNYLREHHDSCSYDERRASSQIAFMGPPRSPLPSAVEGPTIQVISTSAASTSSSSSDSEGSRCPFLNKEHLPELVATRDQLRNYFKQRNRMEQFFKKPWSFILQFLKIILITAMLVTLNRSNSKILFAVNEIKDSISHLIVENFSDDNPVDKIYNYKTLEDMAVFAFKQYTCLSETAISLLGYTNGLDPEVPPNITVVIDHFANISISNAWEVSVNTTEIQHIVQLGCPLCDTSCVNDSRSALRARDYNAGLIKYAMYFPLQVVLIRGYLSQPHCVTLNYELYFENTLETGLETGQNLHYDFTDCNSTHTADDTKSNTILYAYIFLDLTVAAASILSAVICVKKLSYAWRLRQKTGRFIRRTYGRVLNQNERYLFVNWWHVSILVSDVLLLAAAILKFLIDADVVYQFEMSTLCLGLGVWLSYLGLLRYLVFDKHYSMILSTILVALPHLSRFLVCVIIVSLAYIFAGWLILSPYTHKFGTFWVTMETLFSLMNGDDMFATFDLIKTREGDYVQVIIRIFSRIYLYSYVCFFIYIVLSICISIIEDAYTLVSNYQADPCPWIRDSTVFPEFATCWERNIKQRQRRGTHSSFRSRS